MGRLRLRQLHHRSGDWLKHQYFNSSGDAGGLDVVCRPVLSTRRQWWATAFFHLAYELKCCSTALMFMPPLAYPATASAITPALRARNAATSLTSTFIKQLSVSLLLHRGSKSLEMMKLWIPRTLNLFGASSHHRALFSMASSHHPC